VNEPEVSQTASEKEWLLANKPDLCPDCEKKKLLVWVGLNLSGGGTMWLCRDCWHKREAPFVRGNYKSQWD